MTTVPHSTKIHLYHPDRLLPGLDRFVLSNTFLDKELNKSRTPRIQKMIRLYHLDVGNPGFCDSKEEMPFLQMPRLVFPERTWHFDKVRNHLGPKDAADFWCDDRSIQKFVRNPDKYLPVLIACPCVFSFDLSSYQEFPLPLVRYNVFQNRLYAQEMQKAGVNVIPTIQWRDRKSFDFCFLGIPKGSPVAFNAIGPDGRSIPLQLWAEGVTEALRQIEPPVVFIHGEPMNFNFGSVEVHYLENQEIRRMRNNGR